MVTIIAETAALPKPHPFAKRFAPTAKNWRKRLELASSAQKDNRIRVLCDDGKWYDGKLTKVKGTKITILWDSDGSTESFDLNDVQWKTARDKAEQKKVDKQLVELRTELKDVSAAKKSLHTKVKGNKEHPQYQELIDLGKKEFTLFNTIKGLV